MVLDNFQTEHNNPCNDEGSKKESKNDGFIESVDIIEKDKSDNDLPKQVASGDESDAKQDDDKHDITDETIEKILPILEENEIRMQEPNKHAPWDESANPQHDKTGVKQDNDKYDITDETIEKILPILEENEIQMQEPNNHAPWDGSTNPPHDKTGAKQDNDKYETLEEVIEKILPILEGNEIQMQEPEQKYDKIEQSSKIENSNENDDNLEFTFDEIEAVMDNTEVKI